MQRVRVEYPKCMYKGEATLIVEDVQQHKVAWDEGWRGPKGHPRLNKKNQALLDYEASLEADAKAELADQEATPDEAVDANAAGFIGKGDGPNDSAAEPETEEKESDPDPEEDPPKAPQEGDGPSDEVPPTEEEMQEAFCADNPRKKAVHNGYETKAYTAWKDDHGYE